MTTDSPRLTGQSRDSKTTSVDKGADAKLLFPLEDLSLVGLAGGRFPAEIWLVDACFDPRSVSKDD